MKIFKSWKSEFKKKGAMALTAFMLCGSFSTAFAQDTDSTVTIFDKTTGDTASDDSVSGDKTSGNIKTVTGYQTKLDNVYAANVTWGAMTFVYDRRTFKPDTGTLSKTDGLEYVEMGEENIQTSQWYGFDGDNNSVEIENISREDVMLTAKADESVTLADNGMTFSLYADKGDYASDDGYAWGSYASDLDSNILVAHRSKSGKGFVQGTNTKEISKLMQQRVFGANGDEYDDEDPDDKVLIYLNITGNPGNSVSTDSTSKTELGTITLNFQTTSDTLLGVENGDPANNT